MLSVLNVKVVKQVYLELFVKVVPDWRSKPHRLAELGYGGGDF